MLSGEPARRRRARSTVGDGGGEGLLERARELTLDCGDIEETDRDIDFDAAG